MTDYVFLDFDGVCHSWGQGRLPFEPQCLEALAEALQGTQVVVSSSWREQYPLEQLRESLGPVGPLVVGVTPVSEDPTVKHARHKEVQAWLAEHAGPSDGSWDWIALDDEPGHYASGSDRVYRCDRKTGFTTADIEPFRRQLGHLAIYLKHQFSCARDLAVDCWIDRPRRAIEIHGTAFDSSLIFDLVRLWLPRRWGLEPTALLHDDNTGTFRSRFSPWQMTYVMAGARYRLEVIQLQKTPHPPHEAVVLKPEEGT